MGITPIKHQKISTTKQTTYKGYVQTGFTLSQRTVNNNMNAPHHSSMRQTTAAAPPSSQPPDPADLSVRQLFDVELSLLQLADLMPALTLARSGNSYKAVSPALTSRQRRTIRQSRALLDHHRRQTGWWLHLPVFVVAALAHEQAIVWGLWHKVKCC